MKKYLSNLLIKNTLPDIYVVHFADFSFFLLVCGFFRFNQFFRGALVGNHWPKVTKMLWDGDRNIIEKVRRAGLRKECEGEVGTLGPIHKEI